MTATQTLAWATIIVPGLVGIVVAWRNNRSTDRAAASSGMAANFTALAERLAAVEKRLDDKDAELNVVRSRLSTAVHLIRRLLEGDDVDETEVPAWVMEE